MLIADGHSAEEKCEPLSIFQEGKVRPCSGHKAIKRPKIRVLIFNYIYDTMKLDENVYFDIEINLDYLSFKLDERKFNNIKAEILGKISGSNVEYGIDNPIYVRYNLTDINEFEIVEVD